MGRLVDPRNAVRTDTEVSFPRLILSRRTSNPCKLKSRLTITVEEFKWTEIKSIERAELR